MKRKIQYAIITLIGFIAIFFVGQKILFYAQEYIPPGETSINNLINNGNEYQNSNQQSPNIPLYKKFELSFNIDWTRKSDGTKYDPIKDGTTNPFWPYDENPAANTTEHPNAIQAKKGINVDGIFTSPSGKIYTQPGFYYQDYEQDSSKISAFEGPIDWMYPKGNPLWKIRISAQ